MDAEMTNWWGDLIAGYNSNNPNIIVYNKRIYHICDEKSSFPMRGFDGKKVTITKIDGTKVTSTNLWFLSDIPEPYRNILKDNTLYMEWAK